MIPAVPRLVRLVLALIVLALAFACETAANGLDAVARWIMPELTSMAAEEPKP